MVFQGHTRNLVSAYTKRMPVLPLLLVLCAALLLSACTQVSRAPYFKAEDATVDIMDNLLAAQKDVDQRIEKELKNAAHTFEKPLVMQNPYLLSPLTALIIFQTAEASSIEVSINGAAPIVFESATEHAIPIYGLYDGFSNEVVLRDETGNTSTLTIETDAYMGHTVTVQQALPADANDFFLISPDYSSTSAYDGAGKLLWYLSTPGNGGALVFLGNGRFLISDPYQNSSSIRVNYASFMDMDYLGKVHKLYIGEYGYHHEIMPIKNGSEFLLLGSDDSSPYAEGIVYSVDVQTMETTAKLDLYEILHDLAPAWTDSFLEENKFYLTLNGIDYDEESGDVLVSARANSMIARINLETGTIKWIFTDPANVADELKDYLLAPTDDTRYPYGQHACSFLPDGRFAYHNNDIDFLDPNQNISHYKGHYSSNEILRVNEDTKEVSTEWTFDAERKVLSKTSGSLEFLENGHTLISYGSAVKEEAYTSGREINLMNIDHVESLMMELDEEDRVIWRATYPTVIHKVYRSSFYETEQGILPNYHIDAFEEIDGQDTGAHAGDSFDVDSVSAELIDAAPLEGYFNVNINNAIVGLAQGDLDDFQILFIDEAGAGTVFSLAEHGLKTRTAESRTYGVRVAGLEGKQKAYICIEDIWYDTGQIFDFGPYSLESST